MNLTMPRPRYRQLLGLLALTMSLAFVIAAGAFSAADEGQGATADYEIYLPYIQTSVSPPITVLDNDVQVPGLAGFEPHAVVVNPRNPANVVVSQRNVLRISNDFGATFPIQVNSRNFPAGYGLSGDDVLTFDATGALWWSYLMSNDGDGDGQFQTVGTDDITVVVQQVNPITGNRIGAAIDVTPGNNLDDKQWIAADSNPSSPFANNVYVHWTRFNTSPTQEFFSRCVNCVAGPAFSAPASIAAGGGEGFRHQSNITVAPNGDVYASYHTNTCGANEGDGDVILMRDSNGGADFAAGGNPPANVFKTNVFGAGGAEVTCNRQPSTSTVPGARFLMQGAAAPFVVADPVRPGHIYVFVNDDPDNNAGTGDDGDVLMARSTDYGASFTISKVDHAPQGPNSLQVFPQGTSDQDGNLAVFWYDTRRQVNNNGGDGIPGTADDYWNLDVYATVSLDGGLTFSNDFRINDVAFDPQLGAGNFSGDNPPTFRIGEYNGIGAANGIAYAAWTGNAGGGQQILFDVFSMLGAFPDRMEPNEAIDFAVVASLGSDDTYHEARLSLHTVTDEDFFKVVALSTGKLEVEIEYNERVNDLEVEALDRFGNVVGTGLTTSLDVGSSMGSLTIPVVEGGTYFVRVYNPTALNVFAPQATYDLTIVNRPAPAPLGPDLESASDSGLSSLDDVTNIDMPTVRILVNESALEGLNFSATPDANLGDDDPGYKIRVIRNGNTAGYASPVAGQPGVYQFTFSAGTPLTEGANFLTARVLIVDPADDPNVAGITHAFRAGPEASTLVVMLDTVAPPAPSVPDLLAASDSGASDVDNVTRVNPPAFQGTGEANARVRILANGVVVGQEMIGTDLSDGVPGNGLGAWEVTVEPLADGTYAITAEAEDLAGNISSESAAMMPSLVIDTAENGTPQRPTLDLVDEDDTGRSATDNVTRLNELDFRISAEPGTMVVIKDGNTVIDSFVMPAADFTIRTLNLSEGPHPLSSESTDLAGNSSHQSQELLVTVDTTPPAISVPDLATSSDTAGVNDDDVTTLRSPVFVGQEEINALVTIFADGIEVGDGLVGSDLSDGVIGNGLGAYEVTVEPLDDAVYAIRAQLEDQAGNLSPLSEALPVTIANQVLNLSGATADVVFTLTDQRIIGFPGYPSSGSVVGVVGIPIVNLGLNGQSLTILGTASDDEVTYTPTGLQSGYVMRQGSDQRLNFSGAGPSFSIDPAAGIDTVAVNGTIAVDVIETSVDIALTTVQVNGLQTVNVPIANVERLAMYALDGDDTINITIFDTVNAALYVDAGSPASTNPVSDVLNVFAGSPQGKLQKQPGGPVPGSGSVFVSYPLTTGNESRIDHAYVESVRLFK
jgi:hypothetical protein